MSAWFGVNGQRWEMHAWQYGLGWMGSVGICMHGSMVWGGWSDVGDACIAAWLGWMCRDGGCMHGSMVLGGWSEVWDACIAAWLGWMCRCERCMHISMVGVDGQRWEMHAYQHGWG